ncbi:proline and serine-rich protein 3 isoform X2 [Cynoglossus semilaevis]|uniref:proline and serine-rich protein 3 isoform X2 n=1 Tax=Cynoglossus semilaevis TaxID=244447 RepID=UPI000497CB31|nr:proline and serine-rich protein 3 isoform X2 [Cynoglossus semilaevis]
MKSSGPLFTRQNPFQSTSKVGNTHYYPSPKLSTKKKKTTSSTVRSNQQPPHQPQSEDVGSMKATHEQPVFFESWPSAEDGSPPANTSTTSDVQTYAQKAVAEKLGISSQPGVQENSTLAKYIERFRHGRPQSREERQQSASAFGEEGLPFWWRSTPSLLSTSTPTKTNDNDHSLQPVEDDDRPDLFNPSDRHHGDRSPSPSRESVLSDTFHSDSEVIEILQLQERARRLLLRGEGTLSEESVPVTSEGLGSSDFSVPVSVDEPVRRPQIPGLIKPPGVIPNLASTTLPEDDILFQWRLRRKMEQARDWAQSQQQHTRHGNIFSWQPSVSFNPPGGEQDHPCKQPGGSQVPEFSQRDSCPHVSALLKGGPGSSHPGPSSSSAFVVSDSSVSPHQPLAHVPAHMHFLCDVLPCSIQLSHASTQENASHKMHEIHSNIVVKKPHTPVDTANIFTQESIFERSPTRASSEAAENERLLQNTMSGNNLKVKTQRKGSHGQEKKSNKKPKKATRYTVEEEHTDGCNSTKKSSLQQKPPKKVMSETDLQQSRILSIQSCVEPVAPPSPVHKALAQKCCTLLWIHLLIKGCLTRLFHLLFLQLPSQHLNKPQFFSLTCTTLLRSFLSCCGRPKILMKKSLKMTLCCKSFVNNESG